MANEQQNREQLIEKARLAYVEAWEAARSAPGASMAPHGTKSRAGIRAALAVFEEAHTPTEHPAHSGHEYRGGYARAAALAAGDPDWMNATGGTPTDDDREALWDAFDEMHRVTEGGCDTRGKDVADMVIGLGFRRTVQGEPTAAQEVEFPFALGNVTLEQEDGGMWVVITETPRNRTYWIEPGVLAALRAAFNETGENHDS